MLGRVLVVALVLASSRARADEVADLVAKGEALAKQSEYTQAIAAFKQADALRPRAAHACMIGLAYMRREAWPQAELWLAVCEKRAVPGDQPPDWIDAAHQQLAAKLTAAAIPAITVEVTPPGIGAKLTISSFAPDESFDPQTIHLAPGTHVIEVTAPDHHRVSREVTVRAGEPQTISIALPYDASKQHRSPPGASPQSPREASPSLVPWIVMGAGVALTGVAVVYDLAALQPVRDELGSVESGLAYDAVEDDFRGKRIFTVGVFTVGALTLGTGIVLRMTVFKRRDARLTASVGNGGGMFAIGWHQ